MISMSNLTSRPIFVWMTITDVHDVLCVSGDFLGFCLFGEGFGYERHSSLWSCCCLTCPERVRGDCMSNLCTVFFCTKPRHVKLCPGHGAQHFASRYWYNFESWRDVSPAYLEKHSLELEDIQERMDFVGSGHPEAKGMEFLWLGMLVVVICCDYL